MLLELAKILDNALLEAREVERLTAQVPDLKLADAYRIQDEGIRFRLIRGEKVIGLKMGLTSRAKREQMNLDSPIYGVLTDRMQVKAGGTFSLKAKIHPKIEPEIAFVMARELRGRVTPQQALDACSGICAAMEILDSRFVGFKYFSLPDVVADNSSSAYFVLSSQLRNPKDFDLASLAQLAMSMEVDGKVVQAAPSSAISDNPVNSVVQLCELLDARGLSLPAGSIVLAGAATQAVQLVAGMKVRLTVEKLGEVSVVVE